MKYWLIPVAILIAMAVTNPGKKDFERFMEQKIERETADSGKFGQLLGDALSGPLSKVISEQTERKDYLFFSIYILDNEEGSEDGRYLGIVNQFFQLGD